MGGEDAGMNPVELLISALGASLQETARQLSVKQHFQYDKLIFNMTAYGNSPRFTGSDNKIRNGLQIIFINAQIKTQASLKDCQQFITDVVATNPLVKNLNDGMKVKTTITREEDVSR